MLSLDLSSSSVRWNNLSQLGSNIGGKESVPPKFHLRKRKGKDKGLLAKEGKNDCWEDNRWSGRMHVY
jgi:hypothetical protein